MMSQGPNGMRPLELLADMQVKDWSQVLITLCCHKRMLSQGPNGMRPLELLAEMQKGLELRHHHFMLP